jgi:hypothetical protein
VQLIQDFAHGDELDDLAGALVELGALLLGVRREIERDEEALGSVLAGRDGLRAVDVGTADLALLLS